MQKHHLNFYDWLVDEEYGKQCKDNLVIAYNSWFDEKNSNRKKQLFNVVEMYMPIVCDVIAYRYLVKHYTNLFFKLNITIEEYLAYKTERLLDTIKKKKERIDDILSYVYMSFMLSSPRLIYDYGEKIGRCKTIHHILPYYQVVRNKYFGNEVEDLVEHVIYQVDNLYLDDESQAETVHSNIERYSLQQYEHQKSIEDNGMLELNLALAALQKIQTDIQSSKDYLISIFKGWNDGVEDDYFRIKLEGKFDDNYTLVDYITYCFEHDELQSMMNKREFTECLVIYNKLIKSGGKQ